MALGAYSNRKSRARLEDESKELAELKAELKTIRKNIEKVKKLIRVEIGQANAMLKETGGFLPFKERRHGLILAQKIMEKNNL